MNKKMKIKAIFGITLLLFVLVACKEEEEVIPRPKLTVETTNPSVYGASDGAIQLTLKGWKTRPMKFSGATGQPPKTFRD
jgi:hypothetical protein